MHSKWFVILNPAANDGAGHRAWSKIESELKRNDFEFVMKRTERKRHAEIMTMDAIEEGYRNILTVGGDGTLSESVNGIFKQDKLPVNMITSAHIPIGANNNWARYHKVPKSFKVWVAQIKEQKPSLHDVGIVKYCLGNWTHNWYFVNSAACIYPGEVAWVLNEGFSSSIGKYRMLSIILSNLFKFQRKELILVHNGGNKVFKGRFYNCIVGICAYTGGLPMSKHGIHDDGLLAIAHDKGQSNFWDIMQIMYKVFTQKLFKDKRVEITRVKRLDVKLTNKNTTCHVAADDEYLGQAPCSFEVKKRAWNVILPPPHQEDMKYRRLIFN